MPIQFRCPHCQTVLRAPSDKSGARARCKKCSEVVTIPKVGSEQGKSKSRATASSSLAADAAASGHGVQRNTAPLNHPAASEFPSAVADSPADQADARPELNSFQANSDDPFANLPEFQALQEPVQKATGADEEFQQIMMGDQRSDSHRAAEQPIVGQPVAADPLKATPTPVANAGAENISDLLSHFDSSIQTAVTQQKAANIKAVRAKFTVPQIRQAFAKPLGDVQRLKGLKRKQMKSAITVALVPLGFVVFVMVSSYTLFMLYRNWMHSDAEGILHPLIGFPFMLACLVVLCCWIPALNLVFAGLSLLFSRQDDNESATQLTRESQPVMYEFVDQICEKLGSPKPCRIDLDCEFNASASLRRGWFSSDRNDLVLTIGIPLIAVQNTEQLASVIAHEFGHFRQGTAMKTYYVIGRLTHWFISSAQSGLMYFYLFGYLTHRLSGSLSREMEWDADRHAVHLAGTKPFVESSALLERYGVAYSVTIENLIGLFHAGVLVDNIPRLMTHIGRTMPASVIRRLAEDTEKQRQDSLDSHPPTRDRVNAARELNQVGILSMQRPATDLIDHWTDLCKKITLDFYSENLGLSPNEINDSHVTPLEDILRDEHKLLLDKAEKS